MLSYFSQKTYPPYTQMFTPMREIAIERAEECWEKEKKKKTFSLWILKIGHLKVLDWESKDIDTTTRLQIYVHQA